MTGESRANPGGAKHKPGEPRLRNNGQKSGRAPKTQTVTGPNPRNTKVKTKVPGRTQETKQQKQTNEPD